MTSLRYKPEMIIKSKLVKLEWTFNLGHENNKHQ